MILPIARNFFTRSDVTAIARELLGKFLCTRMDEKLTSGMIVETEAYEGVTDRASHAFGGRRTERTEIMYREGGTAYVYLCYGIHSLFNIVTNHTDVPHAVLIRGILPMEGKEIMLKRAGKTRMEPGFGIGPGKVSKILGIHYSHSGLDVTRKPEIEREQGIWLEDHGIPVDPAEIITGPRIGVDYAGQDALLPYRFRFGR